MSQRNLARLRKTTSADQSRVANRVVRRTKGPPRNQRRARPEFSGHGMDFGSFQGFLQRERRQDGRQPLGQHGFARAGRADHDGVVAARRRDFQGAFDVLLALDVREIGLVVVDGVGKNVAGVHYQRLDVALALEEFRRFQHGFHANHVEVVHDGGFGGVLGGQHDALHALPAGFDGNGQHPLDGPQLAVERQLTHDHVFFQTTLALDLLRGFQHA